MLEKEDFGVHDYFKTLTVSQARLRFRNYARLTPKVAMCYKNDLNYKRMGYQCVAHMEAGEPITEENRDTEEHIINCKFYADLKIDLSVDTHWGIVQYFRRVIARRTGLEKYNTESDF